MNLPPEPDFQSQIDQLVGFYHKAYEMVAAKLQATDPAHLLATKKRQQLLAEIADILQSLDEHAADWVNENIPKTYELGQATALVGIGEAATIAKAVDMVASMGVVNREMVKAIALDTHDDLLAATDKVRSEVKRAVRDAVAEHTRIAAVTGDKAKTAAKHVTVQLERIKAPIVDRAGKTWSLDVYAETVVKTKLSQAHREGAIEKALDSGFDLARISAHGAKDACRNFEGALVSLTGQTPGYPTMSQLKSSGLIFHPRCKHLVQPLNPKLLPDSVRQHAEDKASQVEEALKLAEEGKMNSHGMKKGA